MARIAGKNAKIQVCATGGSLADLIGMGNWDLDDKSDNIDVSGFDSSGNVSRIAGMGDYSGTFKGKFDLSETKITGTPVVKKGALLDFKLYIDSTRFYGGTLIVDSVKVAADTKGAIEIDCAFSAGTGGLTYPTT